MVRQSRATTRPRGIHCVPSSSLTTSRPGGTAQAVAARGHGAVPIEDPRLARAADEQAPAHAQEEAVVDPRRQRPLDPPRPIDEEHAIQVAARHRLAQKGDDSPVGGAAGPFVVGESFGARQRQARLRRDDRPQRDADSGHFGIEKDLVVFAVEHRFPF